MKSRVTINRRSLADEVYHSIRRSVLRGDLVSGERLIEERMAAIHGASRTPVREAFLRLEREGLVERRATGGFIVGGLDRSEMDEIMDMRAVLEGHAAARAARRTTPDLVADLKRLLAEYEKAMTSDDVDTMIRVNTEFHDRLYTASASLRLKLMLEELRDYFYRFRRHILGLEGMDAQSHTDHVEMVEAISRGDDRRAEELVREHINRARVALRRESAQGRLEL